MKQILKEFWQFLLEFAQYLVAKVIILGQLFETGKNWLVARLIWKRGSLARPVVHAGLAGLILFVLTSAVLTETGLVSNSFLVKGLENQEVAAAQVLAPVVVTPVTIISDKPRDQIVDYEVKGGDTVSQIGENFGVSVETVRWANDLSDVGEILPGQILKILPVSGVAHKVVKGDTIYTLAKKYSAESQAILDFPFNDIGDNLSLKAGQVLIVPDGSPPAKPRPAPTQYLARQNIPTGPLAASGRFTWPAPGYIGQYFSYYHPAVDIVNNAGPQVVAADSGRVVTAGWPDRSGYGNRVAIDHGNGLITLYAHLSRVCVGVGQYVAKGAAIGLMGTTGRSTGVHLHLEIRKNGTALNPLSLIK